MAIDSNATLLAVLRRLGLFSPEQVEEVTRELIPAYPNPADLGEYLVSIDWLTPYQLQLLLAGGWNELTIGPYQVLDRLGEGGVSEVFKAWDTNRGRIVALKVLRQDVGDAADIARQFHREREALTRLNHPNVIKTYDAGQVGSAHYFAMEFVEGMDLAKYVEVAGPLPVEEACDYIRQVAQGLQHAHQLKLVHRDIKPANLFLLHPPLGLTPALARRAPEPVVKVLDWGLARCLRDPDDSIHPDPAATDSEKGRLIGTAEYIAPEQARDATLVDIRADIYSLGCTFYYLLTGQPPFRGRRLIHVLQAHQEEEPPSIRALRPDVPEELDRMCRKMLEKVPEYRYQIPLLLVAPLRRYAASALARLSAQGTSGRPASASVLSRPGSSPTLPMPSAPGTHAQLPRPQAGGGNAHRPGTSTELPRPGQNGRGPSRR